MKKIAVIILTYNTEEMTQKCLSDFFSYSWKNDVSVYLVDNASTDNTVSRVKKHFPNVTVFAHDKNGGFAAGNNVALRKVQADYYFLLNSDAFVTEGSLDELVDVAEKENFDILSSKLIYPDGRLQPNAGDLPSFLSLLLWVFAFDNLSIVGRYLPSLHRNDPSFYNSTHEVGWVGGTAILFSQKVLKKVGLWDENIFMYGEDVEYCLRAHKKGFRVGITERTLMSHIGGASSQQAKLSQWRGEMKGLIYIYKKYYGDIAASLLKLLFYKALLLRVVAFHLLGRHEVANTYWKIVKTL